MPHIIQHASLVVVLFLLSLSDSWNDDGGLECREAALPCYPDLHSDVPGGVSLVE